MTKRYDYKIFPQTWKMRVLLALAFVAYPLFGLGSAVLLVLATEGFETGVWVTFENRTEEHVTVFFEGEASGTVSARAQDDVFLGYTGFSSKKRLIEVVATTDGRKLLELRIGRPGLADQDWRIVIDDEGP